ncbi:MAG: nucleotidyl transferase AbiEii/AbiGii toxin family protein [Tepidiformaceae bacterium]
MAHADPWFESLQSALAALLDLLEQTGVEAAIIGGIAASTRGEPRLTADIDATAALDSDELDHFVATAAGRGFSTRIGDAPAFARRNRVLLLRHDASGVGIDLGLAGLAFEFEAIERAEWFDLHGLNVPIVTAEDLLVMKAVAHRPQDLIDIAEVLNSNPGLGLERVRAYVREFAAIVEEPGIVETLERLIAEHEATRRRDAENRPPDALS